MMMDAEDKLNKDMVEQLLKYVPTSAERELLQSHITEKDKFARADHFLLEMSRLVLIIIIVVTYAYCNL